MLFLRSIFFAILIPGTVAFVFPYLIVSPAFAESRSWIWIGLLPICIGAAVLIECIWDFVVTGRGTLFPVEPPTHLVVRGLYCHVRNPMYVGVLLVSLGEALLFASLPLLVFSLVACGVFHLWVVFYEEPTLRRMFGPSYEEYTRTVHRWLPRKSRQSSF